VAILSKDMEKDIKFPPYELKSLFGPYCLYSMVCLVGCMNGGQSVLLFVQLPVSDLEGIILVTSEIIIHC
jgi:hypothetical protein